jgi:hypothetical protein
MYRALINCRISLDPVLKVIYLGLLNTLVLSQYGETVNNYDCQMLMGNCSRSSTVFS